MSCVCVCDCDCGCMCLSAHVEVFVRQKTAFRSCAIPPAGIKLESSCALMCCAIFPAAEVDVLENGIETMSQPVQTKE